MIIQHHRFRADQRDFDRLNLTDNVDAIAFFIDYLSDAAIPAMTLISSLI